MADTTVTNGNENKNESTQIEEEKHEDPLNLDPETYPNFGKAENVNFSKNIWDAPIEEKARYADAICKRYHANKEFLDDVVGLDKYIKIYTSTKDELYNLASDPNNLDFSADLFFNHPSRPLNNTALGNIAYLSLHSPEPYASKAKIVLEAIRTNKEAHTAYPNRYHFVIYVDYILIPLAAIGLYKASRYIFTNLLSK
jgi:hypothetical protein